MRKSFLGKMDVNSPWLRPMETKILGGLRSKISQFSDGQQNTLVPRQEPSIQRKSFTYVSVS
jgi:hypothetical protein